MAKDVIARERIRALGAVMLERSVTTQRALDKAEEAAAGFRAQANEWRGAMRDRESAFSNKEDTDRRLHVLEDQQLKTAGSVLGRAGLIGWLFGAAGIALAVVKMFVR